MLKSIGPTTEPCGTPYVRVMWDEKKSQAFTENVQNDIYIHIYIYQTSQGQCQVCLVLTDGIYKMTAK